MKNIKLVNKFFAIAAITGLGVGALGCKHHEEKEENNRLVLELFYKSTCPNVAFTYTDQIQSYRCIAQDNVASPGFEIAGTCDVSLVDVTNPNATGINAIWNAYPIFIDCSSGALTSFVYIFANSEVGPRGTLIDPTIIGGAATDTITANAACYVNGDLRAQETISFPFGGCAPS